MMTRELLLRRFRYLGKEILGTLLVFDNSGNLIFRCMTLELAYKDNEKSISCVPTGGYPLRLEYSNAFNMQLWEMKCVPERSECKFHVANFFRQLQGCVAVGEKHLHIDDDKVLDLGNSRKTLELFHGAMAPATQAYLRIVGMA